MVLCATLVKAEWLKIYKLVFELLGIRADAHKINTVNNHLEEVAFLYKKVRKHYLQY